MDQKRITDFQEIPPVMKLCAEAAIHEGIPFSKFNSKYTMKLVSLAKKGANDNSTKTINSENIKDSVHILSKQRRNQLKALMKGKIVSLSADLATCEYRSFLGKLRSFKGKYVLISFFFLQVSMRIFSMINQIKLGL